MIEQIVAAARATEGWLELNRKSQREIIRRAAEHVYAEIPEAPARRRKRKRARLATAEVETHRKAADTHLRKLRELAAKLPAATLGSLVEDPGELRDWWLMVRAEMDQLCGIEPSQPDEPAQDNRESGQIAHPPPQVTGDTSAPAKGHGADAMEAKATVPVYKEEETGTCSAEDEAAWEHIEARVSAPAIRRVEVALCPPDSSTSAPSGAPPAVHTCPSPPVDPELLKERVFIMTEGGALTEAAATELAQRDLCESCQAASRAGP